MANRRDVRQSTPAVIAASPGADTEWFIFKTASATNAIYIDSCLGGIDNSLPGSLTVHLSLALFALASPQVSETSIPPVTLQDNDLPDAHVNGEANMERVTIPIYVPLYVPATYLLVARLEIANNGAGSIGTPKCFVRIAYHDA